MDTWGEKDLCLFWEWAQEYLGRSGQLRPLSTYGGLGQNLIGEHTIIGAIFQKTTACVLLWCVTLECG